MFKRYLMVLTMLLALPSFANAWYVNAKAGTVGGAVSPAGTLAYTNGQASGEYTVTPAAGYSVQKVTVDGVGVTLTNNKLTVPYLSTKSWRYVVAYFQGATYSIVPTIIGNGVVREDTNESLTGIPAGASRQVLVAPAVGYTASVTAAGATSISAPDQNGAIVVVFNNITANQDVAVTFTLTPVRTANAGQDVTAGLTAATATTLFGAATSNQGAITYAWSGDGLTFGTPAAATTTVYAAVPGTYTATLTATSGGVDVTDTAVVTVRNTQNDACVSCHSLNTPTVVAEAGDKTCVTCHTDNAHANWDTLSQPVDYSTGMHGAASGHTTGQCQRCHTSDGAIAGGGAGYTGGYATVLKFLNYSAIFSSKAGAPAASGISCAACHNHTNGLRATKTATAWDANKVPTTTVTWDPNANGSVDQYDTCTQCHTLTDAAGALVGNYHDGSSASVARTISDSHFDNPLTAVVEGYNLRKTSVNPCADCHNLHKADVEIQEQWAESGHAGKIAAAKLAALEANSIAYYGAAAGTDPYTLRPTSTRTYIEDYKRTTATATNGTLSANALLKTIGVDPLEAFVHYNWSKTNDTVAGDRTGRAACQKCHTATGAANYMSNPAAYLPANNNYSHLAGWTATAGSVQTELLYCWGCHSDSQTGALRNPGAVVADYKFQGAPAVYPSVEASNTCLTCHIGQASGNTITDLTAANNTFTNVSFVNSHYMAAGSLMYVKGGYTNFVPAETAIAGATGTAAISYGQSLTSDVDDTKDKTGATVKGKVSSTHRKLGTAAIHGDSHNPGFFVQGNLDSNGPCVTCHYANGDHTLELGQNALDAVCSKCHAAETGTTAAGLALFIEEEGAAPYEAALDLALDTLLKKYNISYNQAAYPYFYDNNLTPAAAVKDWTRGGVLSAAEAEKLMGACFNINLLKRDPAAFAHARTYARRLLYDTIDFLDNKAIDQTVGATALASGLKDANGADLFVKDVKAYNAVGPDANLKYNITTLYGTTTPGMAYLLGWARNGATEAIAGAWNAWERP